jgi:hypothetical protein
LVNRDTQFLKTASHYITNSKRQTSYCGRRS